MCRICHHADHVGPCQYDFIEDFCGCTWERLPDLYEEGEMPSQSTDSGSKRGTLGASNRTAPGERVNAQTEGLTTMTHVGGLNG